MCNVIRVTFVLLVLLVPQGILAAGSGVQAATSSTAPASAGTSTGQRIGNIISAAVSTAFPAVSKIIDAIWPPGQQNRNKKASDATPAVQTAKEQADAAQRPNTDAMLRAAKNLAVFRSFITTCSDASWRISAMQAFLSAMPPGAQLSPDDIHHLHDLWDPAKQGFDKLQTDAVGPQIDSMDDDFLKSSLTAIRGALASNAGNVGNQLDQGRVVALRQSLDQLEPQVNGVAPLTGILIGDLSTSLAAAANNVAHSAGPAAPDPIATGERQRNMNLIKRFYGVE